MLVRIIRDLTVTDDKSVFIADKLVRLEAVWYLHFHRAGGAVGLKKSMGHRAIAPVDGYETVASGVPPIPSNRLWPIPFDRATNSSMHRPTANSTEDTQGCAEIMPLPQEDSGRALTLGWKLYQKES